MINFKANYIQNIPIKTLDSDNTYKSQDVNFVEIDINNSKDVTAINQVADIWGEKSFADNIVFDIEQNSKDINAQGNLRVFALTKQNSDFQNLDENQILALVDVEKTQSDDLFINYLQVAPQLVYCLRKLPIKRCGSAVLDCLKNLFSNKTITLNSRSRNFFLNNGFIEVTKNHFVWNKFLK